MLAQVLAVAIAVGSFILFINAFTFPEIHRKSDFVWSGVGFFYALVLWVCAGRFTGGVLLGGVASVGLIGWFGWQTLILRWTLIPRDQRSKVKSLGALLTRTISQFTSKLTSLLPGRKSPATTVESVVESQEQVEEPKAAIDDRPTPEEVATELAPESSDELDSEESTEATEPSVEPTLVDLAQEEAGETNELHGETEVDEAIVEDAVSPEVPDSSVTQPLTQKKSAAKSKGFLGQINDRLEAILISLGLKKKHRPMVVLDRSSKSNSEADEFTDEADQLAGEGPEPTTIVPTIETPATEISGTEPVPDSETVLEAEANAPDQAEVIPEETTTPAVDQPVHQPSEPEPLEHSDEETPDIEPGSNEIAVEPTELTPDSEALAVDAAEAEPVTIEVTDATPPAHDELPETTTTTDPDPEAPPSDTPQDSPS